MAEVWYPLLIGGGSNLNDSSNVVPDWANDKIYTFDLISGVSHVWTSAASDGTFIADKLVSAICGISSNTFINTPAICLGTDGTHIYALTSHGATSAAMQANLRLSKIDTSTMTEVAAYIPYAITNKVAEGYFIAGAGDWRLSAFKLNGVDYLALLLNGTDPANIEFIATATLTSVSSYNYTTGGGADTHMCVGEQPNSTTQKLYLMEEAPSGVETNTNFVAVTFTTAPSASDAALGTLSATDIDPAWVGVNVDADPTSLMFCSVDNSLVFLMLDDSASTPDPDAKLVKINTTSGAVAWTVDVTNDIFQLVNFQFGQAAALSDLSSNSLIFCNPNAAEYLTVDLATGASTVTAATHFDGVSPSQNGVRQSALWDSARQRLIYYYEGSNDLGAAWPSGGWAVWGPDIVASSGSGSEGGISCCADPVIVDPAVIALLNAHQLRVAHLVQMDFLTTPRRLWNGHHDLTVGGHTWSGLRKLGGIDGLEESDDLSASTMKFTISGVDANVLALAIGEARDEYVGRLVTVFLQFIDAAWQPVGAPIARAAGIMDGIEISRARDGDGQSVRTLTLTAEVIFYGRGVPPAGYYTAPDQQLRSPGDHGLSFVPEIQNTVIQVPW